MIEIVDSSEVAKRYRPPIGSIAKGRICHKCGSNVTWTNKKGTALWSKYYDKKGNWDGMSFLCNICQSKGYTQCADWRNGRLDPNSEVGKGFIGQQIVAKTFGVDDCNIKMDSFKFYVDLDKHSKYGICDVKTSSLNQKYNRWKFGGFQKECDNFVFVGMDSNWPWRDVESMHIIPCDEIVNKTHITIVKNPSSRGSVYTKFRVDPKPFNDTYHNMNINNCTILREY